MKKITKLIFSCAAVAAITAALGTAALAANADPVIEGDITGLAYADGVVTIPAGYTSTGTQQTVLIFEATDDGLTATADNIQYIDQVDTEKSETLAKAITLKKPITGDVEQAVTYVVRIGGNTVDPSVAKGFYESTITIAPENVTPPGSDRKLGNVNDDEYINPTDALRIMTHAGAEPGTAGRLTGDKLQAADVTDDGFANPTDALRIMTFAAASDDVKDTGFGGKFTVADKTKTVAED